MRLWAGEVRSKQDKEMQEKKEKQEKLTVEMDAMYKMEPFTKYAEHAAKVSCYVLLCTWLYLMLMII